MDRNEITRAILITGSGSGIGAAVALRLAAPGVAIMLHARGNRAGCHDIARKVEAKGARARVTLVEMSKPGAGKKLVDATVKAFGRLDVLVSNHGLAKRAPIGELTGAELDELYGSILRGFFEMATAALPHLKNARDGRVVTVSAHGAHIFRNDYPIYTGSAAVKAGLEAMTRAFAVQMAPFGVTVNSVVPGLIRRDPGKKSALTPAEWKKLVAKIPMARVGEPIEVAELIAFLASPVAGYITGQCIHINGGLI